MKIHWTKAITNVMVVICYKPDDAIYIYDLFFCIFSFTCNFNSCWFMIIQTCLHKLYIGQKKNTNVMVVVCDKPDDAMYGLCFVV